jgi:hypothetical protein
LAADEDEEDPEGAAGGGGGGLPPIAVVGASASDDVDNQAKDALPRGIQAEAEAPISLPEEESGGALGGTGIGGQGGEV